MDDKQRVYRANYSNAAPENPGLQKKLNQFLLKWWPSAVQPELRFLKSLPKDSKIVELGCGDGEFLQALKIQGFQNLQGVEMVLRPNTPKNLNVIQEDLLQYLPKLLNQSVDVIVLLDVLEHFSRNEASRILVLIKDKLKVGGRLVLRVPNMMSPTGQFYQFSDVTHEAAYTEVSLAQILVAQGFGKVVVRGSEKWLKYWIDPRRWPGFVVYVVWLLLRSCLSVASGGPKVLTGNLAALGIKLSI